MRAGSIVITMCLYGESENDSACKGLDPVMAKVVPLKGGHHFGGDYQSIAEIILKEAG
jgi:type IV secretory pathway VirJ component